MLPTLRARPAAWLFAVETEMASFCTPVAAIEALLSARVSDESLRVELPTPVTFALFVALVAALLAATESALFAVMFCAEVAALVYAVALDASAEACALSAASFACARL